MFLDIRRDLLPTFAEVRAALRTATARGDAESVCILEAASAELLATYRAVTAASLAIMFAAHGYRRADAAE